MLVSLWIEIRYAARRLVRDARLTLTAVLTLALGLGAAVVMTDMLDRLLIRPPAHVTGGDRLTRLYVGSPGSYASLNDYPTFAGLESELDAELEQVAAYFTRSFSLGRGAGARQVEAVAHSPQYFATLGVAPVLGSLATDADQDAPGAAISYGLWQSRYGGSPDVLGRTLTLGTDIFTITGVLPRGFAGVDFTAVDVFIPLAVAGPDWMSSWQTMQAPWLNIVARLRDGIEREAAGVHANSVYRNLSGIAELRTGNLVFGDLKRSPDMTETTRVALWIGGMALVVLLIACGNVANLLYVRGLRRMHETSVQTALGASRARLARGFLIEAALLAATAGVVTYFMVVSGGVVVRGLFLPTVAALVEPLDPRLMLLTVAGCLSAMLLFGLLPALRLTTLRMIAPGQGTPRGRHALLNLFSGIQVALSVPLLVGAGLFVLSFSNAANQNVGFDRSNVVVARTNLFEAGENVEANTAAHRLLEAELASMPEIESTAMVKQDPWGGALDGEMFSVPGRELPQGPTIGPMPEGSTFGLMNGVDPEFFELMRLPLVEGRLFTPAENTEDAPPVVVVSEAFAQAIWGSDSPVGECLRIGFRQAEAPCTEVIGVVGDARWSPVIRPSGVPEQVMFRPIDQRATSGRLNRTILARTRTDADALLPILRARLQAAGTDLPYVQIRTVEESFEPLLRPWRLGATVFVAFGLFALIIAAVGLVVVISHDVTKRSHELAVRSACGAQSSELVRSVLLRSLGVLLAGLAAGIALAVIGARLLEGLLFGISPADFRVFVAAGTTLLIFALLASWLPARRAARIDPAIALRSE